MVLKLNAAFRQVDRVESVPQSGVCIVAMSKLGKESPSITALQTNGDKKVFVISFYFLNSFFKISSRQVWPEVKSEYDLTYFSIEFYPAF